MFKPDQWALRVAHHLPWLHYWWNTQKWFPSSSLISGSLDMFSPPDMEIVSKFPPQLEEQKVHSFKINTLYIFSHICMSINTLTEYEIEFMC